MKKQASDLANGEALLRMLRDFVRRSRWQTLSARTLEAAAIVGAGNSACAIVHHLLPLASVCREIAFDLFLALGLARMLPAIARLLHRQIDFVAAAERLERCRPELQQRLSTWASCRLRGDGSTLNLELMRVLETELSDSGDILKRCLPWRRVAVRAGIVAGIGLLACLLNRVSNGSLAAMLPPWR